MQAALGVLVLASVAAALVYLGLLLWAAREDGRDQKRRQRPPGRR